MSQTTNDTALGGAFGGEDEGLVQTNPEVEASQNPTTTKTITDESALGGSFGSEESPLIQSLSGEAQASADEAQASEIAAQQAASNAQASEDAAEAFKNAAQLSESNAGASASSAATSASAATDKATEASASASNAAISAVNAADSETNAASSAAQAATSATNAANSEFNADYSASSALSSANDSASSALASSASASSAAASASQAVTSASGAAASESNAAISETNAATSATNASTSETNAATSAANAAISETNAATSAVSAATSATNASNSATAAATSETNSATSETNAATSAANAAISETNAATSETNAATSATESASSAAASESSATAAATSATNAATSETNAATSETNAANSALDASTNATAASGSATAAANSATSAATSATNASNSATASASSATDSANSASNSSNSAGDAAVSATQAATSATNAATSETNAATSETNAASSASAASASATAASTSEANAASSATNSASSAAASLASATDSANSATSAASSASSASASATSAATSANSASTSATTAINALDNFEDIYLGAKTSDPTVDNDGDPLQTGALYFNTTDGDLRIWTGTTWTNVVVDADIQAQIDTAVADLVNGAPGTLDTLNELAAALGDDPNYAATTASTLSSLQSQITTLDNNKYEEGDDVLVNSLEFQGAGFNAGVIQWDSTNSTASLSMGNGVNQQIGEEVYYPKKTRNMTGLTIPNGTPVMLVGGLGEDSYIAPAIADGSIPHDYYVGVTTEEILDGNYGRVLFFGSVNNIDTSTYNKGDLLYVSDTVNGGFTTTKPSSPSHTILAALVTKVDATNGRLFVRTQTTPESSEITYDNSTSELTSTNVKGALDELQQNKASVDLLSSNIVLFPTDSASTEVTGYNKLVINKEDPDYDTVAVNIPTGSIGTTETLVGALASDDGLVEGSIAGITVTLIGNIQKLTGNNNQGASFYFKIYRREANGTEHEMGESNHTNIIYETTGYEQFSASVYLNDGGLSSFSLTDRFVVKFYAIANATGTSYQFQFGGTSPVRAIVPVPISVVPSRSAAETPVDTSNFNGKLGGTDTNVQAALDTLDNHDHDSEYASLTGYNKSNWDTAYSWGDHSLEGYLTGIPAEYLTQAEGDLRYLSASAETLPDQTGHAGQFLTTNGTTADWATVDTSLGDTAYGWGNHASAGYLTTETDPTVPSHVKGITTTNITNWNTAYGWGNHADAGYLTSYIETDPVFSASAASGITTTDISNWDTAYGWGDHALAGYLTSHQDISGKANLSGDTFTGPVSFTESGNTFRIDPHGAGVDLHSTGNIAPHYQTNFTLYTGNIGTGTQRLSLDSSGNLSVTGTLSASGYNKSNWDTAYAYSQVGHLPLTGGTISGLTTFSSTSDAQIFLNGNGSTWAGIAWTDSGGTDYTWFNGATETFTIGGGGSAGVAGKKLHIDGGTTIGSTYDGFTVPTDGLRVLGITQTDGGISSVGSVHLYNNSSDNHLGLFSVNGARQRADSRNEGVYARTHWYGVSDTGATSNFRHAWYDGNSYVNITAENDGVTFGGHLTATNVHVNGDLKMSGSDSYIWTPSTSNGFTGIWDAHNSRSVLRYENDQDTIRLQRFTNVGNQSSTNDGNWNARLNVTGSQHARLDVFNDADDIRVSMYSHVGNGNGRVGTLSNHNLGLMTNGSVYATLKTSGVFDVLNGYQVNGTTVIDSSRSLINLDGSLKSDSVFQFLTSSNAAQYGKFHGVSVSNSYSIGSYGGYFNAQSGYMVNNTTIIDSGRNLTNIGTGSFSGKVDFQGDAAIEGGSGYGIFKGYTSNNNHMIVVRGKVSGSGSSPTIVGGHNTTFCEFMNPRDETAGWFFKDSYSNGAYTYSEIARITVSGVHHGSSMRAPIFYDSNNTGYYTDPNGTSNLLFVQMPYRGNGTSNLVVNNGGSENWRAIDVDGGNNNHGIGTSGTSRSVFGRNALCFHTSASDSIRFHSDGWDTTFEVTGAAGNAWIKGDLRVPIVYDKDNTNYYWNPNTSSAHRLQTPTGYLDLGSMNSSYCHFQTDRAKFYFQKEVVVDGAGITSYDASANAKFPIYYDYNNTGWYLDPSSTSNINSLVATGHIYGRSSNAQYSNLYRFGGIYFTWDSDSYGTNTHHSIRSTDGDNYGDHITINSFGNIRFNFDSNSNGTNYCYWGHATTGTGNVLMYLDESGNLISNTGSHRAPIFYDQNDTTTYIDPRSTSHIKGRVDIQENASASGYTFMSFRSVTTNNQLGAIYRQYGTMYYSTNSDYRLKENVVDLTSAIDRVKLLRPKRFNFIDFPEVTVDGFIAHEVQEVIPEAVLGEKDEVDHHGNEKYQSMDHSKLVPLLTAALQEALQEIDNLKARLDVLESQ